MAGDDEGFLNRWSRLKREGAGPEEVPPEPDLSPEPPEPVRIEDLPPVASLTRDSDFTVFLRPDVPPGLKRAALRKLWTSDPVLANLDDPRDYAEDYTGIGTVEQVVKTLYRVGQGFLTEDAPAEPEPEPEPVAALPEAEPSPLPLAQRSITPETSG